MSQVRSLVANAAVVDGESWAELFRQHNPGTINNQWSTHTHDDAHAVFGFLEGRSARPS